MPAADVGLQRITAVVAEDEAVLREELVTRLGAAWPLLRIAATASDGVEALALFDRHRPEVMFLDIEMPGLTGLQVARQVSGRCHVVFMTAYDEYAVSAFEQGAVDYLLKPYDVDRLGIAIGRLRDRIASSPPLLDHILNNLAMAAKTVSYLSWIRASRGSEIDLITVDDVCYFKAESKYTTVVTETGEALIRRSIKELEAELDPARFWRIHRSTIVNLSAIRSISRSIRGRMFVKLRNRAERLDVSEAYHHVFRHM